MFPDCRAKRSKNCSPRDSDNCPGASSCRTCQPTCDNQNSCEKPFLCQELNITTWCDCRPPIHRGFCKYCPPKTKPRMLSTLMYRDNCGICRNCCSTDFCHYNYFNQYTTPYYYPCNNPCYPYNYDIDCQTPIEFPCFGKTCTKIPMAPLKTMTKTDLIAELAKKPVKCKKKMPNKTSRRSSESRDGDNTRINEKSGSARVAADARVGERIHGTYTLDDDNDRGVEKRISRDGSNGGASEGNNNIYADGANQMNLNRNRVAKFCSNLADKFQNDAAVYCTRSTCVCRCGAASRDGVQQNRPIEANDCCQFQNVCSSSKNRYGAINNNSATILGPKAQNSYDSHESHNNYGGQNESQINKMSSPYNKFEGRNAKEGTNTAKLNSKPGGYTTPNVYPRKCNCMAAQQSPLKTSCCRQYPGMTGKMGPQLDVITEEYEPEDYNDYGGYQDNSNYTSNGAQNDGKAKAQKSMEDFCCDFLNIVCENILESVQKCMGSMLEMYCCQTMEKMEAMCCKFDSSEMNTRRILCDLLERVSDQSDNNLQQFQILMQCFNKIETANENQKSASGSFSTTGESPQNSNKSCQCNAEENDDDKICCFVLDRKNCSTTNENGQCLLTASPNGNNATCCMVNATDTPKYCCCQNPATNEISNEDAASETAKSYGCNDAVVDPDSVKDDNDASPECECPDTDSFTCIIETCKATCRQKSGAQVNNDPNQSITNSMIDNGSIDKVRKMSALKYPNFLMTNQNAAASCYAKCNEKKPSTCHVVEDDTFETSGYATDPEDNADEVANGGPATTHKKTKPKRSSKTPPTADLRQRSSNPDIYDLPSSAKSPRNSTRLSRL